MKRLSEEPKPHTVIVYSDEEENRLTIQFWLSTEKVYPLSKSARLRTLFIDAYAKHVSFSSAKDVEEEMQQLEIAEEKLITLDNEMHRDLGADVMQQFIDNQFIMKKDLGSYFTLRAAFAARRHKRTLHVDDYSAIVQSICKCFESLMKTMLWDSGFPTTYINNKTVEFSVVDYFYWNDRTKAYCLDRKYLKMDDKTRYEVGRLYSYAYGSVRNKVSHGGFPWKHITINDYNKANDWFDKVTYSMKEEYKILAPYCRSLQNKNRVL